MAECVVLFEGYVRDGATRIAGTVSLVRDWELIVVVDPGMVPDQDAILTPLQEQGLISPP